MNTKSIVGLFLLVLTLTLPINVSFSAESINDGKCINNDDMYYRKMVLETPYHIVEKDHKWGVVGENGETIIPFEYSFITPDYYCGMYFVAHKQGLAGLLDANGTVVLPFEYEMLYLEPHEATIVAGLKPNNSWQLFNLESRKPLINMSFYDRDFLFYYNGLLAAKSENGNMGAIDTKGNVVIPFKYQKLGNFYHNVAEYHVVNKYDEVKVGIIDKNNNIIFPAIYDKAYPEVWSDSNAIPAFYTLINGSIKKVVNIETKKEKITNYDSLIPVASKYFETHTSDNKTGLIDTDFNQILKDIYFSLDTDSNPDNWIASLDGDHYGVVTKNDKVLIPPVYESLTRLSATRIIASKKGRYGVLDLSNNVVIPFKYDHLVLLEGKTSGDLNFIVASKGNKEALMDENGKLLIPFADHFLSSYTVKSDILSFSTGEKAGLITTDNKVLFTIDLYNDFTPLSQFDNRYLVSYSTYDMDTEGVRHATLIDDKGNDLCAEKHDVIKWLGLPEGRSLETALMPFEDTSGKYGYLDMQCNIKIKPYLTNVKQAEKRDD